MYAERAVPVFQVHKSMLESYAPEVSDGPLYNVTLGMRVQLKKDWVDVSRKMMDVKCTAKVDGADVKEDATTVRLRPLTDHTLSQERHIYNNTGERTTRWSSTLFDSSPSGFRERAALPLRKGRIIYDDSLQSRSCDQITTARTTYVTTYISLPDNSSVRHDR